MKASSNRNLVFVEDGDTINVVVSTPPNVFDPTGALGAFAQSYRVVAASGTEPILELVPLSSVPSRINVDDYRRELDRAT